MRIGSVYFEITNKCNLNCRTCFNSSGLQQIAKEIAFDKLLKAILYFSEMGANRFIFGGGEPMLYLLLDELLGTIRQNPQITYAFTTNGTIYNREFISLYHKLPNLNVQISIDGSCEEINALTRGSGNFNKAYSFVEALRSPVKKPLIKMVISKQNLHNVKDYYRLAMKLDAIPEYAFVNCMGNAFVNWDEMAIDTRQKMAVIQMIEQLNEEYQMKAGLPLCTTGCPLSNEKKELNIFIKVDGRIMPCQLLYDDCFTLGNIFFFDQNQFDKRCSEMAKLAKQRENNDYGCGRCLVQDGCKKGCMAVAYNLTGNPLSCDGDCELRKMQFVQRNLKKHIITRNTL